MTAVLMKRKHIEENVIKNTIRKTEKEAEVDQDIGNTVRSQKSIKEIEAGHVQQIEMKDVRESMIKVTGDEILKQ